MKSSALIPLVFLDGACSVQAAEQLGPTGPPVSHFRGTCEATRTARSLRQKPVTPAYYPTGEKVIKGGTSLRPATQPTR